VPWITLTLVLACALASLLPGGPQLLAYDRVAVAAGDWWRPLSCQLVQSTPGAGALDVGAFLLLGAFLERRSRVGLVTTLVLAGGSVALLLQWGLPELQQATGAAGLTAGLLAFGAAWMARNAPQGALRWLALLVLVGFTGVLLYEAQLRGQAAVDGQAVVVRLVGAAAGLVTAALAPLWRRR